MKENNLKTLLDYNNEKWNSYYEFSNLNKPIPNGIECPNCKNELMDSDPMVTLTSIPPQKNIHCEKCDYKGYRIA